MSVERRIAILSLLLQRRFITAAELAQEHGVSVRSVYRDFASLKEAGIPILPFPGHAGGYALDADFRLESHVLTAEELKGILLGVKTLAATVPSPEMDRSLKAVRGLLPVVDDSPEDSELAVRLLSDTADREMFDLLSRLRQAISAKQVVRFRYLSAKDEEILREVEPHQLRFDRIAWYLAAWCRLRQDFRVFRLSRVRELRPTGEVFLRRILPPLPRVDTTYQPTVTVQVTAESPLRFRLGDFFGASAVGTTPDGRLTVTFSLPEDEWLYGFLLSFGPGLRVESPPRVVEAVALRAKAIAALYSSQPHQT